MQENNHFVNNDILTEEDFKNLINEKLLRIEQEVKIRKEIDKKLNSVLHYFDIK